MTQTCYSTSHQTIWKSLSCSSIDHRSIDGVDFAIDVQRDIGAKIGFGVTTGSIDIDRQVGFSLT